RSYIAWMNPYPLLPEHAVIASREHVAQAWRGSGEQPGGRSLAIIVADLLKLASRLPGWIGFYNGPDAGASIPHHFHYQFFPRPAGCPVYPLEQAAARRFAGQSVPTYPLEFAHWRGDAGTVSRTATRRIQLWADHPPDGVSAPTANFIASAGNDGALDLYFVPRDRIRARSPGMSGLVGGLETLGELVFSSEEEQQRLRSGDIDFEEIERMLAHVSTPL
ncbi:MAG: DUF4922 domain-containing protein, partial [Gammaproteobacteria bacterium]|nr:DUF4922 domain-containing protein [Gammaproteobacteria bacterium]